MCVLPACIELPVHSWVPAHCHPSDFSLCCSGFCHQSSLKADMGIVFLTSGNCDLRLEKVKTLISLMVWRKQFKKWRNLRNLCSISNPGMLVQMFDTGRAYTNHLARKKCFVIMPFSFFQCCGKNLDWPQKIDI